MIADRNRRQRRKPRRTTGGASCRSVVCADEYAGFDRFGREIDHGWYAYGASADRDRLTYGYDRTSNRLYRENTLTSGRDEFYGHDGLNRRIKSRIDSGVPSNPTEIDTYVHYFCSSTWQIVSS